MDLKHTAALYRLGRANGSILVDAALSAMQSGLESDSLGCLAGMTDPLMNEAAPLFEGVLAEFNIPIPASKKDAATMLAHYYAHEYLEGRMPPSVAGRRLANLWNDSERDSSLTAFYAIVSQLDRADNQYKSASGDLKAHKDWLVQSLNLDLEMALKVFLQTEGSPPPTA